MARTSSERRAVVVTGGTKGIGRAMVEALLARGADVGLCGRDTRPVDEAKDALVSRFGEGRVVAQVYDVTREEHLEGLFSATKEAFGRVNVWVNNAGTSSPQLSFLEQDTSTVRSVVETNLLRPPAQPAPRLSVLDTPPTDRSAAVMNSSTLPCRARRHPVVPTHGYPVQQATGRTAAPKPLARVFHWGACVGKQ